jgi:O-antigen ligase
VRWRRAGFELPIYLLIVTTIGSELANGQSISDKGLQGDVIKALMFFASFLLVVYLMVSVIRTRRHLDFLVKVFVVGGAVVAGSSIVEARTGVNIFEHLERVLPFLRFVHDQTDVQTRQGGLRVFGSAQSPIALGAALVMVVPLALYTAITNSKRWWIPVALTGLASLATVSRTPVIMLMVVGVTYFILKPRQLLKMWPLLIPAVIAAQVAVPGALGSLKASFFPPGGIVAEQSQHAGWAGSGRIADLGPAFQQWQQRPFLGEGYGTRKTDRKNRQQQILDDQWLKTLLENGALGTFAYVWLYVAFIRRIGRIARRDDGDRGWLCTAFVASIASFAVGMFFYDAFSFIQVTLLSYIVLGFGAVVLSIGDRWTTEPRPATR